MRKCTQVAPIESVRMSVFGTEDLLRHPMTGQGGLNLRKIGSRHMQTKASKPNRAVLKNASKFYNIRTGYATNLHSRKSDRPWYALAVVTSSSSVARVFFMGRPLFGGACRASIVLARSRDTYSNLHGQAHQKRHTATKPLGTP